jgi:hypothetical protein
MIARKAKPRDASRENSARKRRLHGEVRSTMLEIVHLLEDHPAGLDVNRPRRIAGQALGDLIRIDESNTLDELGRRRRLAHSIRPPQYDHLRLAFLVSFRFHQTASDALA